MNLWVQLIKFFQNEIEKTSKIHDISASPVTTRIASGLSLVADLLGMVHPRPFLILLNSLNSVPILAKKWGIKSQRSIHRTVQENDVIYSGSNMVKPILT